MGAWGLVFPPLVFLEQLWAPRLFGWCVLDYGGHINCVSVAEENLVVPVVVSRESSWVVFYIDCVPCCACAAGVVSLGWLWVVH